VIIVSPLHALVMAFYVNHTTLPCLPGPTFLKKGSAMVVVLCLQLRRSFGCYF
jgi:hypothetical protein